MFLVFFVPLLITINYYDILFNIIGKIAPESTNTIRETISFIAMYFICFIACVFFCIWLCIDLMRIHKAIDLIGGGICGAATGIVCSGVLLMMWMTLPISEEKFSIDDGQLFFPNTKMTMQAATFVAGRIPSKRPFIGERFLRDLRFGLPQPPTMGAGFYVSSIPSGQRVFIDSSGMSPAKFLETLKERIMNPRREPTATEAKRPFGEKRRSPVFIEQDAKQALVAVVMDAVPQEIAIENSAAKMFVHDGEAYYSRESVSDRIMFVKIYRIARDSGVASQIALFQPGDHEVAEQVMPGYLPSRNCFKFNVSEVRTDLMQAGVTDNLDELVQRLQFGGKVWFEGLAGKPTCAEIAPNGKCHIFEAKAPDIEAANKESSATWYPPR